MIPAPQYFTRGVIRQPAVFHAAYLPRTRGVVLLAPPRSLRKSSPILWVRNVAGNRYVGSSVLRHSQVRGEISLQREHRGGVAERVFLSGLLLHDAGTGRGAPRRSAAGRNGSCVSPPVSAPSGGGVREPLRARQVQCEPITPTFGCAKEKLRRGKGGFVASRCVVKRGLLVACRYGRDLVGGGARTSILFGCSV